MGLIIVTVTAVLVARLLGGRLRALERFPVHDWPLVLGVVAAATTAVVAPATPLPGWAHPAALACGGGCALLYGLRNRSVHGAGLIALGLLLNAAVVAGNGGMPVSASAAAQAGVDAAAAAAQPGRVAGSDVRLAPLADVIPVPLPYFPAVVSPGDLLVAAGLAQLVAAAMLRELRHTPAPPRSRHRQAPAGGTPRRRPAATGRRPDPDSPAQVAPAEEPRDGATDAEYDSELLRVIPSGDPRLAQGPSPRGPSARAIPPGGPPRAGRPPGGSPPSGSA